MRLQHSQIRVCSHVPRSYSERLLPILPTVAAETPDDNTPTTPHYKRYFSTDQFVLTHWRRDGHTHRRSKKKKKYAFTGAVGSQPLPSGVATIGAVVTAFPPGNTSILDVCDRQPADPVLTGVTNWARLNAGATLT